MPSFFKKKYNNGVILVYRQIENPYFFYLTHYYNTGSKDFPIGLLHFFEHCAFSAPRGINVPEYIRFLRKNNISKEATTSRENLEFHYSGLQEDWKKIVDSFFECFDNKEITKKVFDNEKKRILHEIEEEDINDLTITTKNFSQLYKEKEMVTSSLGNKDALKEHSLEDLRILMKKISKQPFVLYIQSSLSFNSITDYIDEKTAKMSFVDKKINKKIKLNNGGDTVISLSKLEKNIVQYSFLYFQKQSIQNYICANIIEDFFSFNGGSLLSEKLRFEVGVYDYSISKIFYRHGILFVFSFEIDDVVVEDFKKSFKKWIHQKIEMTEEDFLVLKKKLKFAYLQNLSDPFTRFETERELYQVLGDVIFENNIIEELEKITLKDVKIFHKKMIKDSIQSCVFGIKNKTHDSGVFIQNGYGNYHY